AYRTEGYGLGSVLTSLDPESIAAGLRGLVNSPPPPSAFENHQRDHSLARLERELLEVATLLSKA
ncbi:MAG: hypothetical protein AAFQ82_19095, partial [Myxococcota bacterium]